MTDNGRLIVQDDAVALFDTAKFEQMCRVAKVMAAASLVPEHLQNTPEENHEADCMLIVQQARRWQMDPFALAQCSFVVKGKLGYEGKAIAAVVNSRADLKERLKYDVTGEGQKCAVIVRGTFKCEDEERTIEATWAEGRKMSPHGAKWEHPGMESQQLCYYAARKWARLHAPELILGVLSADEIQAMAGNIGPDYAKDIGGHSEMAPPQAGNPLDRMNALADQLETKVDLPAQESHQDGGDDIADTDTGEVTEGAPWPIQAQHGVAHEQEGFDLDTPHVIAVDMIKRGPKPTFPDMTAARRAMADRLDELVSDGVAGAIEQLTERNKAVIAQWDQDSQASWASAINMALDDIAERSAA